MHVLAHLLHSQVCGLEALKLFPQDTHTGKVIVTSTLVAEFPVGGTLPPRMRTIITSPPMTGTRLSFQLHGSVWSALCVPLVALLSTEPSIRLRLFMWLLWLHRPVNLFICLCIFSNYLVYFHCCFGGLCFLYDVIHGLLWTILSQTCFQ